MTTAFTLHGSLTSPFVRRVRMVALERDIPITFVDAFTDEGQKALRALSPIWKVPLAVIDGDVVTDSRSIIDELLRRHGTGTLRPLEHSARVAEDFFIHVVDAAVDAGVKRFYLKRDGVDPDVPASTKKDGERILACLAWVNDRVTDGRVVGLTGFGRAEMALISALGWLRFREVVDVDGFANLLAFEQAHADRASVRETMPRVA
jgi:glutathione S-transferase